MDKIFKINEKTVPLNGWGDDLNGQYIARIEKDYIDILKSNNDIKDQAKEVIEKNENKINKIIKGILKTVDTLDNIINNMEENFKVMDEQTKCYHGYLKQVQKQLLNTLLESGISELQNYDKGFDPEWHDALDTGPDNKINNGVITKIVKRGFIKDGKCFRLATVIIS